jgi:hypothetical protein
MTEEKILCHQCGKDLVMKFIELKDLVFCSSSCFENFKTSMSRKDLGRISLNSMVMDSPPMNRSGYPSTPMITLRCVVTALRSFQKPAMKS